ncbi:MAG: sensor domain-containing diguanylate cyclase [Lachnospiraceae bacterium]|nr:sensor domain-containing diguanylate cyclase [Lachnospiraceae bacterium]
MTAAVCALLCIAILRCNNTIYDRDSVIRKYFMFLLTSYIIYFALDCLWGAANSSAGLFGRGGFAVLSFFNHLMAVVAVACWCFFLTNYFGFRDTRITIALQFIPLACAVIVLVTQIFVNTVFSIDEACRYHAGPYRIYLFYIEYSYYLITFIKVIFFLISHHSEHDTAYKRIVLECAVVPVVFGVFQYVYPDGPYSSLGLMFSAVLAFNGMMVIEKHRKSQNFELISKDRYMMLEAISDGYVSVIMLDLENGTDTVIKTTPYARSLIEPEMSLKEKVLNIFRNAAVPEDADGLAEFGDIDKLPEKMTNRRSLSTEYRSKNIGWCMAAFIAAERDSERNLKKVVLAIQSIDERKTKELEYEEALSRAYKNENAVLAELIKMQSTGVIASQDRKIVIVNDAALSIFGREGQDPIGMDVFEFWKGSPIRTEDEDKEKFLEVEREGGSFSYQTVSYVEGNEKDMRHLRADVKRVDLLDGSSVMITCLTDITAGKLLEDKLRTLSETDMLTNIANRRCGESQIRLLMQEGVEGIYCLLDINGFKTINDTFGHGTGDDTLIAVASAVRSSFRSDDILMRLGGDEFAIYMRGVTTTDLARIRIARLFENIARIELPNIPKGSVTVSLGAVAVRAAGGMITEDYTEIYRRADAQMYKCKGRPGSNLSIEDAAEKERNQNEES